MTKSLAPIIRELIPHILRKADAPMSAEQIRIELVRQHGVHASTASVGANLGFMRVAGKVGFVNVLLGIHRYSRETYPVRLRHWFFGPENKSWARKWALQKRLENENKYLSTLPPTHPKRRRRPITDDMRQMIEDFAS